MGLTEKKEQIAPVEMKDEQEAVLKDAIKKVSIIEETKSVKVLVHLLNVREHANADSKIVTTVKSGETLKVEKNPIGEFYRVVEPMNGYVMQKFVG